MIECSVKFLDLEGRERRLSATGGNKSAAIQAAKEKIYQHGGKVREVFRVRRLCKSLHVQESEYRVL
tara:strand:+ start:299 stop:499 length:201 start_codon:yes stop_codon:yes gene_type:complete